MRRIPLVLIAPFFIVMRVEAQCGWPAVHVGANVAASVQALVARVDPTDKPTDALKALHEWTDKCDHVAGREAVTLFRRAAERNADDMALQALLGIALARGPDVQWEYDGGYVLRSAHRLTNAEKEAVRLLSETEQKTGWPELSIELAQLALATRADATQHVAITTLEKTPEFDNNPTLQLLDAEIAMQRMDLPRAMTLSANAAHEGSNAAPRVHAIATLLRDPQSTHGADEYMAGLAAADSVTLSYYYEDLSLLMTDAEAAEWQRLPSSQRAAWLRKAWQWRASIATLTLANRLSVHFHRVATAFAQYGRHTAGGARPWSALWLPLPLEELPLDDRGIVYVRHGAPDEIVKPNAVLLTLEAWYYRGLAGGRALLEFDKGNEYQTPPVTFGDYFLAEPFRCAYNSMNPGRPTVREAARQEEIKLYRIREHLEDYADRIRSLDASIRPDDNGCYNTIAGDSGRFTLHTPSGEARRIIGTAITQTETASPRLKRGIDVLLNTYAFRRNDKPLLAVVSNMDAFGLARSSAGAYNLRLFTASEDWSTKTLSRSDTTLSLRRSAPFVKGETLRLTTLLRPEIGNSITIRSAIIDANDTTHGQVTTLVRTIEDNAGPSLSDIVIGGANKTSWLPGPPVATPLPGHRMTEGSEFQLYVEAYKLSEGQKYDVEITLTPSKQGSLKGTIEDLIRKRSAVSVKFADVAHPDADGIARITHAVMADAVSGPYYLELHITLPNGEIISSQTNLTIYSRDK